MSSAPPSATPQQDKPVQVGRYLLSARLASGGMSSVHVGRLLGPAGFGRTVAIKQLHPHLAAEKDFVAMLLDEARLASRIRHPNVVSVSDVVQQEQQLLLVMEYVPGISLAELVRLASEQKQQVPLPIVSAIGCGILHGLHAAHEATDERGRALGIVHRDVSPQNVLVGSDGVARLVDFGVAKAVGRLHTTMSGQVKGKMAYMAPEQLRSGTVDRRADIYAAAMVLWETMTLRRPFGDDGDGAFRRMSTDVPPPSSVIADLPAAVDDLMAWALCRAPEQRMPTAQQMARELELAVPPASAIEVAAFVAELADDLLLEREALVAGAEQQELPVPETPAAIAVPTPTPTPSGGRPVRRVMLGLGALVALGVGVMVLVGARPFSTLGPVPGPSATAATRSPVPVPAPAQPPPTVGAAVHPAVPTPDPAPAPAVPEPVAPPPEKAAAQPGAPAAAPVRVPPRLRRPPRMKKSVAAARKRRSINCSPPFTIGPDGVKQYKLECL